VPVADRVELAALGRRHRPGTKRVRGQLAEHGWSDGWAQPPAEVVRELIA
jgi:hypothetical protein